MPDDRLAEGRGFQEGDRFSYRSTSSLEIVTWTRDASGTWTADDGRGMPATDLDVTLNHDASDTTLTDAAGQAIERPLRPESP